MIILFYLFFIFIWRVEYLGFKNIMTSVSLSVFVMFIFVFYDCFPFFIDF